MWSRFGHIASKKRSRLGGEKANDLVFVNANLRLLNKVAGGPTPEEYIGWDHDSKQDESSTLKLFPMMIPSSMILLLSLLLPLNSPLGFFVSTIYYRLLSLTF